jgi:hypothetical protein
MLAATYLLDQPVPNALFEGPSAVQGFPKPCQFPKQTRCFVSYNNLDGGDQRGARILKERSTIWTADKGYHAIGGAKFACVNPLTGAAPLSNAPASTNRGAAAASGLERGTEPALLPGQTGAICRNDLLWVEVNRPAALSRTRFELGTFYKITSYNLFYAALSADVQARVEALKGSEIGP